MGIGLLRVIWSFRLGLPEFMDPLSAAQRRDFPVKDLGLNYGLGLGL